MTVARAGVIVVKRDHDYDVTQERLTIAAVAVYAASGFAYLWVRAHEFARTDDVDIRGAEELVAYGLIAVLVPLVAGYAIGRFWAPCLVLVLLACALLASALEPLQRPPPAEIEASPGLVWLVLCVWHVPLLLSGVAARRFVQWRIALRAQRSAR